MVEQDGVEVPEWFAMSAPYRREMIAKELLDKKGIENFIPMRYAVVSNRLGHKSKRLVPAIHNLIFAHTTRTAIQAAKQGVNCLQYHTRLEEGRNRPIIVPDGQMEQFIAICNQQDEEVRFLSPEEIDLEKGTRVRIIGGRFDGVEGRFVKVKGVRNRRVVVELEHITTVVLSEIEPDLIEVIEEQPVRGRREKNDETVVRS